MRRISQSGRWSACFLLTAALNSTDASAHSNVPCRAEFVYTGTQNRKAMYLQGEAIRACEEGNRLSSESLRLNLMSNKLSATRMRLVAETARLDALWERAHASDPELYADYDGRDRSQRIMRRDADRLEFDVQRLSQETERLQGEAQRLWLLAQDVNAEAIDERGRRFGAREPLSHEDLATLRAKVIALAHASGARYTPSEIAR